MTAPVLIRQAGKNDAEMLAGLLRKAQTKPRADVPEDRLEGEADRIADLVMAMPEPAVQRKPS